MPSARRPVGIPIGFELAKVSSGTGILDCSHTQSHVRLNLSVVAGISAIILLLPHRQPLHPTSIRGRESPKLAETCISGHAT